MGGVFVVFPVPHFVSAVVFPPLTRPTGVFNRRQAAGGRRQAAVIRCNTRITGVIHGCNTRQGCGEAKKTSQNINFARFWGDGDGGSGGCNTL